MMAETTEQALRASEALLRLSQEAGRVGSFEVDLRQGRGRVSRQFEIIHGLAPDAFENTYEAWLRLVHADDRAAVRAAIRAGVARRKPELHNEYRIVRPDGEVRWIESRAALAYDERGAPVYMIGVSIDVTERRQAEEHQRMLIAELDHRVKNTLALVRALAQRTLPPGVEARAFQERIAALAHAHGLLSRSGWTGASLRRLIELELSPYRTASRRVTLRGADVTVEPRVAQSLVLTVHELITNAVKYGALSTPRGRVKVIWAVKPSGRLVLLWREADGPATRPPVHPGFGSRLIKRSVAYELGGRARLSFHPEGARCSISVPLGGPAPSATPAWPRPRQPA